MSYSLESLPRQLDEMKKSTDASGSALNQIVVEVKKPWYKKPEAWFAFIAMLAAVAAVITTLLM